MADTAAGAPSKAPLDEVMMAMDVVDTLRHRQNLVARELASDEREARLIERLKEIYRNQGIEVPESILAEGVRALEEDRFVYEPPQAGFGVSLAKLYINRGQWAKRVSAVVLLVIAFLFGNWFLFERPTANRIEAAVSEANQRITDNDQAAKQLSGRINQARDTLAKAVSEAPDSVRSAVLARKSVVEQSLATAEGRLKAVRELGLEPSVDTGDYEGISERLQATLTEQSQLVEEAGRVVGEAESGVAEIGEFKVIGDKAELAYADLERSNADADTLQVGKRIVGRVQAALTRGDQPAAEEQLEMLAALTSLPAALDSEYAAVNAVAKDATARATAREHGEYGMQALRNGDVRAAMASLDELRALKAQLEQQYIIRVVSRPNEMSAIWREGTGAAGIKNYYLIVEAVTDNGEALTLPITSEEDQTTVNTKVWGVRVSEQVYNYVYEDKKRDGIVDDNVVAVKQRGMLQPEYEIPGQDPNVAPGAITQW